MTTMKRIVALAAFALIVGAPHAARSSEDDLYYQGKIDEVTNDGRIILKGHRFKVDQDTEVKDSLNRPATPQELMQGIDVEVTYEETSTGWHAKKIIASMLR